MAESVMIAGMFAYIGEEYAILMKKTGNQSEHDRANPGLCHLAILACHSLEGLAGLGRKTIQIQTIIPVRTTDKRQPMRSQILDNMVKGAL